LEARKPPSYSRAAAGSKLDPFGSEVPPRGETFGDDMAATAMIDRLIHSEILSFKDDSYRLRGKDLDARPARTG
jgi:hypothetical protein